MKNTKSFSVLVFGLALILLAGCSPSAAPTVTPTPTPSRLGPAMVQVENSILARPQSGLQQADLVYEYLAEGGHFAGGSMAPKIQAVVWYLERGGRQAIVTNPENVERALGGETGTRFTPD